MLVLQVLRCTFGILGKFNDRDSCVFEAASSFFKFYFFTDVISLEFMVCYLC